MPTTDLKLQVRRKPEVLNRIVCTCRRRGVEIVALTYANGEMSLRVAGDGERTRRIERWLAALVDVVEVRRDPTALKAPGAPAPPTARERC